MSRKGFWIVLSVVAVAAFVAGLWLGRGDGNGTGTPEEIGAGAGAEEADFDPSSLPPGSVHISPVRQQLAGVRVGSVSKEPYVHNLRFLGRVAADETKVFRLVASVDGWIQESYDNSVGTLVEKNELLATFYSPQFLDSQQAYIYALDAVDRLQQSRRQELGRQELPAQTAFDQLTVQRQVDILRGLGMSDPQLEEIGKSRQIMLNIKLLSPVSGFVTRRYVSPGQRFLKGTELFEITDLSRVWILGDVYENEVGYIRAGLRATASSPHHGKSFAAKVTEVLPLFDPATRTVQVRLETANPGYLLRPDMFLDVELPVTLDPAVSVPADAVIFSGTRETVFVDRGSGYFEPRAVKTGWRLGDRVEVVEGLAPGERIVLSGNFLVDSESRLQAVAMGIYGEIRTDPVCGMEVDDVRAEALGLTSVFEGRKYFFCSRECKERFDEDPAGFVKPPGGSQPAPSEDGRR